MTSEFHTVLDRQNTGSSKWSRYEADVLPLWVADTDFATAKPIMDAIAERLAHPILGYAVPTDELRNVILKHLDKAYGWQVSPSALRFIGGVAPGFNVAVRALVSPQKGLIVDRPIYGPIRNVASNWGLRRIDVDLLPNGSRWRYDLDRIEELAPEADAILLCNPQNPTGMRATEDELRRLADIAIAHDLSIISDEVHCDLTLTDGRHIPIARLSPEIAKRTITMMSASKTYNIAGLKTAFAVIEDESLRNRFLAAGEGVLDSLNPIGYTATQAAYAHGEAWRGELVNYLKANRDHLMGEMGRRFPKISVRAPEATYLAWLDCSALGLDRPAQAYFLEKAKVGLSCGTEFGGAAMADHCRLNFGCPRSTLDEALSRMEASLP
ncbi:MAG: PatB family C-S lyase [Pseudomonadota bacterium]